MTSHYLYDVFIYILMIYICLFFRSLNLLNVIDYPSLDPFNVFSSTSDGAHLPTRNLWFQSMTSVSINFNYFTAKVTDAFDNILDNPRVLNSVGFSCPWIFSDSHFKSLISKMIVKEIFDHQDNSY